ncbi:MAG: type I-C CRISPR-associated protein Cas8c/Csd1 [Pyrinomonadaceae bacterium]
MLLQALNEFYERATKPNANGESLIEEAAFNKKYVRWIIPLKLDGTLEGSGLIENPEIKKGGVSFSLPRTNRPKVAGGVAEFLWEGLEAIFNLKTDPEAVEANERKRLSQDNNRQAKFDDFWGQIEAASVAVNSPLIEAVLKFRENYVSTDAPDFLHWGILKEGEKAAWLVKTAGGNEEKMKADSFTFQVDGDFLFEDAALRKFWRERFADERSSSEADSEKGLCLVTGKTETAISASHLPKIGGFLSTGASLISFDKDSFRSYGLEKSYNAPVSFPAVEAYTNSLNFLLSNPNHRLRIGDTTLIFWAQKSEDVTDLFAELFERPDEKTLETFMKKSFTGDSNFYDFDREQFYSVTLGGNAGRIVVRNWMQMTVAQAARNFKKWFEDLKIIKIRSHENDKIAPLNLFLLAKSTVREAKDLRPEVPTQLYRAALESHAPSLAAAKGLLDRIAVDLAKDGKKSLGNLSRFSLLRLIINRNEKEKEKMINPDLNEIEDYPYNCGRLLAVFEELQSVYHGKDFTGASVVEKYYGTAASSPNSAFGILWRLHQHHLRKISRTFPGIAVNLRKKIEGITQHFERLNPADLKSPPQFPRSFNLQEQGRFALGFYQQCAADRKASEERKAQKTTEQTNQSEIQGEQTI